MVYARGFSDFHIFSHGFSWWSRDPHGLLVQLLLILSDAVGKGCLSNLLAQKTDDGQVGSPRELSGKIWKKYGIRKLDEQQKTILVRIVMVKDHSFDFRPPWSTRSTGPRLARPVSEPWSPSPSAALRWWTLDTTGIPPGQGTKQVELGVNVT